MSVPEAIISLVNAIDEAGVLGLEDATLPVAHAATLLAYVMAPTPARLREAALLVLAADRLGRRQRPLAWRTALDALREVLAEADKP